MRTAGPPIGSVACVDQHDRSIYVDLDRLDIEWEMKTELTLAQIRRIEALQNIFGDVVPGPMSEWLNNFRYEIPVNAEDELRLWERLGRVYQDELGDRPGMPPDERRFLADAILKASNFSELKELLSANPWLKRLPNLERVFYRVKSGGP